MRSVRAKFAALTLLARDRLTKDQGSLSRRALYRMWKQTLDDKDGYVWHKVTPT